MKTDGKKEISQFCSNVKHVERKVEDVFKRVHNQNDARAKNIDCDHPGMVLSKHGRFCNVECHHHRIKTQTHNLHYHC